jgi:hypothetical protein
VSFLWVYATARESRITLQVWRRRWRVLRCVRWGVAGGNGRDWRGRAGPSDADDNDPIPNLLDFKIVFHVPALEDESALTLSRKARGKSRQQCFFNLSECRRGRETQGKDRVPLIAPAKIVLSWNVSRHLVYRRKSARVLADLSNDRPLAIATRLMREWIEFGIMYNSQIRPGPTNLGASIKGRVALSESQTNRELMGLNSDRRSRQSIRILSERPEMRMMMPRETVSVQLRGIRSDSCRSAMVQLSEHFLCKSGAWSNLPRKINRASDKTSAMTAAF